MDGTLCSILECNTFLTVCEYMSFTKAAQALHLTQPAISQHIHVLEEQYGTKLFSLNKRHISLTKEGEELRQFAHSMSVDIKRFHQLFNQSKKEEIISFGATLSIGEFTLPPIIASIMKKNKERRIVMQVNNTRHLLAMIDKGEIDFAFIEGSFNKANYSYNLFSLERFIAVGSLEAKERYAHKSLESVQGERLLVREKGSGTRAVLEQILLEKGLVIESFKHVNTIGNLNVIKKLVSENLGISFMYETAAQDAIDMGLLHEIPLTDFHVKREFNFVYSLNSSFEHKFLDFLEECREIY